MAKHQNFTSAQKDALMMIGAEGAWLGYRSIGHYDRTQRQVNQDVAELLAERGFVRLEGKRAVLTPAGVEVAQRLHPYKWFLDRFTDKEQS